MWGAFFTTYIKWDVQQKKVLGGAISRDLKKAEAALRLQGKLEIGSAHQFWKDEGR